MPAISAKVSPLSRRSRSRGNRLANESYGYQAKPSEVSSVFVSSKRLRKTEPVPHQTTEPDKRFPIGFHHVKCSGSAWPPAPQERRWCAVSNSNAAKPTPRCSIASLAASSCCLAILIRSFLTDPSSTFAIPRKYARVQSAGLKREAVAGEPFERAGHMINGVAGERHRTVAAFIVDFKPEIGLRFFAHLDVVRDLPAGRHRAHAALVHSVAQGRRLSAYGR